MFMAFEFLYLWSRLFTPYIHLMLGLDAKPVYWHLIWSLSVVNNSKVVMDLYRWSGLLILSTINKETRQYLSTFFLSFKWYLCNICFIIIISVWLLVYTQITMVLACFNIYLFPILIWNFFQVDKHSLILIWYLYCLFCTVVTIG